MKVLSAEDMIKMIEGVQSENLDVSIGKGDELSASSVAAVYGSALLIGSVFKNLFSVV